MSEKILIVGGGPAGFVAAIRAANLASELGLSTEITLVDLNREPLRKLKAAGNGRCNLSNRHIKNNKYVSATGSVNQRLFNTVCNHFKQYSEDFFRTLHLPIFYDAAGRAYPLSEQSIVVVDKLRQAAERQDIHLLLQTKVLRILPIDGRFSAELSPGGLRYFDQVVLACGSLAAPQLGGCDSLSILAEELNLPYHPFVPALVPLCVNWPVTDQRLRRKLNGIRFKGRAKLRGSDQSELAQSEGEFQITEYGISGIAAMDLSCALAPYLDSNHSLREKFYLEIDLVPTLSESDLCDWLCHHCTQADRVEYYRDLFSAFVKIPLAEALAEKVDRNFPLASALKLLRSLHLPITGVLDYTRAQVAVGGLKLNALNVDLSFKSYDKFYACGEMLDVTGHTGGYNLHWALASGHLVGSTIIQKMRLL